MPDFRNGTYQCELHSQGMIQQEGHLGWVCLNSRAFSSGKHTRDESGICFRRIKHLGGGRGQLAGTEWEKVEMNKGASGWRDLN